MHIPPFAHFCHQPSPSSHQQCCHLTELIFWGLHYVSCLSLVRFNSRVWQFPNCVCFYLHLRWEGSVQKITVSSHFHSSGFPCELWFSYNVWAPRKPSLILASFVLCKTVATKLQPAPILPPSDKDCVVMHSKTNMALHQTHGPVAILTEQ